MKRARLARLKRQTLFITYTLLATGHALSTYLKRAGHQQGLSIPESSGAKGIKSLRVKQIVITYDLLELLCVSGIPASLPFLVLFLAPRLHILSRELNRERTDRLRNSNILKCDGFS